MYFSVKLHIYRYNTSYTHCAMRIVQFIFDSISVSSQSPFPICHPKIYLSFYGALALQSLLLLMNCDLQEICALVFPVPVRTNNPCSLGHSFCQIFANQSMFLFNYSFDATPGYMCTCISSSSEDKQPLLPWTLILPDFCKSKYVSFQL